MHHGFRHHRQRETGVPETIGIAWTLPDHPDAAIVVDIGWDHKPASLARESLGLVGVQAVFMPLRRLC